MVRGLPAMLRSLTAVACIISALTILPPARQNQSGKTDQYGDPLPAGAVARLGTIRWRHDAAVAFASFAPDGKTVVSVSWSGTIFVWEYPGGKELRRIAPPADEQVQANVAAMTADGKTIAIARETVSDGAVQRMIVVHDLASGKELAKLKFDSGRPYNLAFTNDGKHLSSWEANGVGRIWDWGAGKQLSQFSIDTSRGPSRTYFGYSPDNKTLVLFGNSNSLRIVDLTTGQEIASSGPAGAITLRFTPDAKHLLTQDTTQAGFKWDLASGKPVGPVASPEKTGKDMIISSDGRVGVMNGPFQGGVVKGAKGGFAIANRLSLIDVASGKTYSTIDLDDRSQIGVSLFSPDSKILAIATLSDDERIDLIDVATGRVLQLINVPNEAAGSKASGLYGQLANLLFSADGKRLAYQRNVNAATITVFEVSTGKQLSSLALNPGAEPAPPQLNPKNAKGGKVGTKITSTPLRGAFSPDGRLLAVVAGDQVKVFDAATGILRQNLVPKASERAVAALKYDHGPIIAYSPDGNLLALAGGNDRLVHLWDSSSGKELAFFQGHLSAVTAVAFAPGGQALASVSSDGMVLIWNIRAKEFP
jgi:WD40 repeat protein